MNKPFTVGGISTAAWRRSGRAAEELEDENKRPKKLLAEAELDKAVLKEASRGNY